MATFSSSPRTGLPRESGGEPWPPVTDAAVEAAAAAASGAVPSAAAESFETAAEVVPPIEPAAKAAPAEVADGEVSGVEAESAGAETEVAETEVDEAAEVDEAEVAETAVADVAGADAGSADAPAAAGASAAVAGAAAASAVEVPLRRGLPRVAGGEPWPPAGFAPASAVIATKPAAAAAPAADEAPDALATPVVAETPVEDAPAAKAAPTKLTPAPKAGGPTKLAPAPKAGGPTKLAPAPKAGGPTKLTPAPKGGGPTKLTPAGTPAPTKLTPAAKAGGPTKLTPAAKAGGPTKLAPASKAGGPTKLTPAAKSGGPTKLSAPAKPAAGGPTKLSAPAKPAATSAKAPAAKAAPAKAAPVKPAATSASKPAAKKPAAAVAERELFGKPLSVIRKWTILGLIGLIVAAGIIVLAARGLTTLPGVPEFMEKYPGEYAPPAFVDPGFPWWARWTHFLNLFFMILIIRSGNQVRHQQKPPAFYTPKKGGKKISINLWLHTSLDLLWVANGIIFVVLLFVSGHWARIVPTSWEVFPNALSALLQYMTLEWPAEHGWVVYNSLQQIMYFLIVFVAAPLAAITGVRMSEWWPNDNEKLSKYYPAPLARAIHYPTMLFFVVFILIHVFLVFATGMRANLNHMFWGSDLENWVGFGWFVAAMAVVVGAWFAARPLVLGTIAGFFGKVSTR